jgi:hypothetical protein
MPDFENEDIDKMFEEIISSDDLDEIKAPNIDGIITIDNVSVETLLKELIFISQSLSRSIGHISDLMLNFTSIDDYDLEDEVREILGNMYKLSEDLDEYMIELILEESEDIEDEDDEDDGDEE